MTKADKIVKIAAVAAVGAASFVGMQAPVEASPAAAGGVTVGLTEDSTGISVGFTNTTEKEAVIYRNNNKIGTVKTITGTTDYKYVDAIKNLGLHLGSLSTNLSVADGPLSLDGEAITDGSTPEGAIKTANITVPKDGLELTHKLDYKVELPATGQSFEDSITLTANPSKMFYVVSSEKTIKQADFKEADSNTINVPLSDIVGNYLHVYLQDPDTGLMTKTTSYLLSDFYTGTGAPTFKNTKPVIKIDNSKIASSVEVTVEMPEGLKETKAKIEYSTGYGNFKEYTGPFKVDTNTAVQARIADGLGNYSAIEMYTITNIVPDFGSEYTVKTDGNKLTIEVPEGKDYLSHIDISVNDSMWVAYNNAITAENGEHTVKTRAVSKDGTVSDVKETKWIVGSQTDSEKEEDKAKAEYAEALAKATKATELAEKSKLQSDIDKAMELLKPLAVADQLALQKRLDAVQEYISSLEASAAITKVGAVPTMENLIAALKAIGKVSTESTRKTLETQLDTHYQKALDSSTAAKVDAAVEGLVEETLILPTKGGLYAINKLIGEVSDAALKAELQESIKEITVLVEHAEALKAANELVAKAEKLQTQKAHDIAKAAVDKLPDSKAKTKLLKQLEKVQAIVKVTDTGLISDIQAGKKVAISDIANYTGVAIPTSLLDVITATIKDLKESATLESVTAVVELHVAYDKAIRGMSAKEINAYNTLYKASKDKVPTLGKMPNPTTLANAYKFLSDESVLPELIKGLEEETGAALTAYFRTLAPSIIKGENSGSAILDFADQRELESNRTYQVVKAALLTKEALTQNKEEHRTLAKAYVGTLKNGGYKQTLLSSLGVTGKDLENAGVREDEIIKPGDVPTTGDGEDVGEGEISEEELKKYTSPKVDPTGTLQGVSEFFMYEELRGTEFEEYFKGMDYAKSEIDMFMEPMKKDEEVYFKLKNGMEYVFVLPSDAETLVMVGEELENGDIKLNIFIDGKLVRVTGQMEWTKAHAGHIVLDDETGPKGPHKFEYSAGKYTFFYASKGTISTIPGPTDFKDLKGTWANDYINFLSARGVITETENFRPKENITRAEFAVWLGKAVGKVSYSEGQTFKDVDYSDKDTAAYIESLAAIGVIKGFEGNFNPDGEITRQQAALMISRVLDYHGMDISGTPKFKDVDSISKEAQAVVGKLQELGIFTGDAGKFNPTGKLTRQQASKVVTMTSTNTGDLK